MFEKLNDFGTLMSRLSQALVRYQGLIDQFGKHSDQRCWGVAGSVLSELNNAMACDGPQPLLKSTSSRP